MENGPGLGQVHVKNRQPKHICDSSTNTRDYAKSSISNQGRNEEDSAAPSPSLGHKHLGDQPHFLKTIDFESSSYSHMQQEPFKLFCRSQTHNLVSRIIPLEEICQHLCRTQHKPLSPLLRTRIFMNQFCALLPSNSFGDLPLQQLLDLLRILVLMVR